MLLRQALRLGVRKLVLTEINNTASYIEVFRLLQERKLTDQLEIVLGMEFREDQALHFIAIAKNNRGFENINRYRSYLNNQAMAVPTRAPEMEDVFFIYPFQEIIDPDSLRENEYLGVRLSQRSKLMFPPVRALTDKMVILQPVTFRDKKTYNIHRLLRAIAHNTLLSKLAPQQQAHDDEIMIPEKELAQKFNDFPAIIGNTKKILDACSFQIELGKDKNKRNLTGNREDDWLFLVTKAWEGFCVRYDAENAEIRKRFQRELEVIELKDFCSYYLIAYDLVRFADDHGFEHVGRGSGANSVVAYCLGITDVDPIELDLYFERFLNEERTSPPDFDIDFSWKDRDAVYTYIFSKYGNTHACLLGTHVTYQWRSVLRELGKVFGLPKEEIDALVEYRKENRNRDHITRLIFQYAACFVEKQPADETRRKQMSPQEKEDEEDERDALPAHLSIHAGGVLITEEPIYSYTATDLPPKGYPVAHLEMHNAEDLGIYKLDILSQRGLGHLKETVRLVKQNKNVDVDIHRFNEFKKDEKIRELLRSSRAMGCFYVESPAMRMLLGKLRCEDYLTLVAASSIIRPGVASSGMMRTYIERFHAVRNGQTYESIHPKMDELMKETYGVMVYQEDVIKVAHHFAKLTLTEADVLRRGMSGKYRSRSEFDRVRERFFLNCDAQGYPPAVTARVWFEIESFSGYSFAKGHSASYAVESYQSLYLKAHYPLEFMVGVINNFGGFYRTEFYFHEARMSGGTIEAPCINHSEYYTTLHGTTVYMGFVHLKSLETAVAQSVLPERERNGPFQSLHHFLRRVKLGLEQVRILIRMGAFRFSGKNKQQLLWEAMLFFSEAKVRVPSTAALFDLEPDNYPLPPFQVNELEDTFDQIELLGFPLGDPFRLLPDNNYGDTRACQLMQRLGKKIVIAGYVVTTKDTRTKSGDTMHFGTFYDSHGEFFDTVHFPDVARKYPFRGRGFYLISGTVVEDFGIPVIEVVAMEKMPMINKRELDPVG